jgi:hypothetical protein
MFAREQWKNDLAELFSTDIFEFNTKLSYYICICQPRQQPLHKMTAFIIRHTFAKK